jgi:hypothetical protein
MRDETLYITFEQAKSIAESSVISKLKLFNLKIPKCVLQEFFLEGDFCWVFFMSKEIIMPETTPGRYSIAVGKHGIHRILGDFSERPETYQGNLEKLSSIFEKIGLHE